MHVLTFSSFIDKLSCRKPLGGFSGCSLGTLATQNFQLQGAVQVVLQRVELPEKVG